VLKLDGTACGHFQGRWMGESIEVQTTSQLRLQFQKTAWLASEFQLVEAGTGVALARGSRRGLLSRAWNLTLTTGPADMVSAGLLGTGYRVQQAGETVGEVNQRGWCASGWIVNADDRLARTDLIFIGLVYHTIWQRRRNSS
jgi:hypothetical protein